MKIGRGFIVFTAVFGALLTSCSSASLVACKSDVDCAPYPGTVCYEGHCRKPSQIKGDVDFAMSMSLPDAAVFDISASPEPSDLSLFCGDAGSSSCPASAPVCAGDTCRGCTIADNTTCAIRSQLTPHCDPSSGMCVGCTSDSDCSDGTNTRCSFDGSCRQPCSTNTDCTTSSVCDFGTFDGNSVCARAEEVIYVRGACGSAPDGSMGNPYCTLDGAVTRLPSGGFIHVLQSTTSIAPGALPLAHTFVIVSDSGGTLGSNAAATGIQITSGANVLLYKLKLSGLSTAVLCTSAQLTTQYVQIEKSTTGIDSTNCDLTVKATWLSKNGTGASLHGSVGMDMINSIVSESTKVGLALDGSASMFLNYDTIANNAPTSATPSAIASTSTGGGTVYNSIVFGNKQVDYRSWTGNISFLNCDSDSPEAGMYSTAPAFVTTQTPQLGGGFALVNSYHLLTGNADNAACCIDRGKAFLYGKLAPRTDFDGDARPKGALDDIGADEAQ